MEEAREDAEEPDAEEEAREDAVEPDAEDEVREDAEGEAKLIWRVNLKSPLVPLLIE